MIPSKSIPTIPPDTYKALPAAYAFLDPQLRESVATESPRVVFIEVTNHCNLLCETCPRTFTSYEEPQTLSWENFLRIAEQFPKMERAVLHGIGEPLINRNLPQMIAHLKQRGVTTLFNTNATLLNEEWGRKLIESGLDEMRCSIDGAKTETYAKIRGAPLLHKIVGNLAKFSELQQKMNAAKPKASIWMTGMRENIEELPDLIRLAHRMGIKEVYVQRMVYYLDHDHAPGLMDAGHALFDDFDELADRCIAEAELIAKEHEIILRASGATDPRRSLSAAMLRDHQPWRGCLRPWTTAYVTANGNCLPCCISPFATNDYQSLKMGNLFEKSFDEIWNDERYQAWRTSLLSDQPPAPCKGCGVHWSL